MSSKVNISQLYQKKFILDSPNKVSYSLPTPLGQQVSTRYGQFSQRLYQPPRKVSIRCTKITKKQDLRELIKQRAQSFYFKEYHNNILTKPNKVSQPQLRQSEFLQQLMKLSQQQLGQLQVSFGGKNKLLKMLKSFYQQRNKTKQEQKQKHKLTKSNFKPIRSISERYQKKPVISRDIQRFSRENQRSNKKQVIIPKVGLGEKDLAPWQNGDFEGL